MRGYAKVCNTGDGGSDEGGLSVRVCVGRLRLATLRGRERGYLGRPSPFGYAGGFSVWWFGDGFSVWLR